MILRGWAAILEQLPGIQDKRTARKFLEENAVPVVYLKKYPIIHSNELDKLWKRLREESTNEDTS